MKTKENENKNKTQPVAVKEPDYFTQEDNTMLYKIMSDEIVKQETIYRHSPTHRLEYMLVRYKKIFKKIENDLGLS